MKKLIYIIGLSLVLTGCTYETGEYEENYNSFPEDINYEGYSSSEGGYLNEDMKLVIKDINALTEKYKDKDNIDEMGADSLYINIYEDSIGWIDDIAFNNYDMRNSDYFNELIEVLDRSIAEGLSDYVSQVRGQELEDKGLITRKIGRTVVYAEDRGDEGANYIQVKINLLDIKDQYYREVFESISDGKYIVGKVLMGHELNLIDFANISSDESMYPYDNLNIRYNMFFKDKDFKKVNILIQGENNEEMPYDDVGVFINLLNNLDIKEQDEKDILVNEYKNALKDKDKTKDMSFDNYNLLIKSGKGDTYTGNDRKLVYFSLQAK